MRPELFLVSKRMGVIALSRVGRPPNLLSQCFGRVNIHLKFNPALVLVRRAGDGVDLYI